MSNAATTRGYSVQASGFSHGMLYAAGCDAADGTFTREEAAAKAAELEDTLRAENAREAFVSVYLNGGIVKKMVAIAGIWFPAINLTH